MYNMWQQVCKRKLRYVSTYITSGIYTYIYSDYIAS